MVQECLAQEHSFELVCAWIHNLGFTVNYQMCEAGGFAEIIVQNRSEVNSTCPTCQMISCPVRGKFHWLSYGILMKAVCCSAVARVVISRVELQAKECGMVAMQPPRLPWQPSLRAVLPACLGTPLVVPALNDGRPTFVGLCLLCDDCVAIDEVEALT